MAVLLELHQLEMDVSADVDLARHADEGCRCDDNRFY